MRLLLWCACGKAKPVKLARKLVCGTLARPNLALSLQKGRIVLRLAEIRATGFAGKTALALAVGSGTMRA